MAAINEELKNFVLTGGKPSRSEFTQHITSWQEPKRLVAKAISGTTVQYICHNPSCKFSVTASLRGNPLEYQVKMDAPENNIVHTCPDEQSPPTPKSASKSASEKSSRSKTPQKERTSGTGKTPLKERNPASAKTPTMENTPMGVHDSESENTTERMPRLSVEERHSSTTEVLNTNGVRIASRGADEGLYPSVAVSDFFNAAGGLFCVVSLFFRLF
jgi:hypothetical protein